MTRSHFTSWLALAVAANWLVAATWKLLNPTTFASTIAAHGLTADLPQWAIWAIPAVEVILALGVGVFGGTNRRAPAVSALVASAAVLVVFSGYIVAVPGEQLAAVGCGCHGQKAGAVVSGLGLGPRASQLASNAVFLTAHGYLLWVAHAQEHAV